MKRRRMNMMENRKQILTKHLCFLDEDLRESFLNIRQKCYILTKFDMLDLPLDRTRTITEFQEEQNHKSRNRRPEFKNIHDVFFNTLKSICLFSTEKFTRENISGSILDKDENYSIKALPYTHEAVLRSHLQHLGKFIRLIDYMIIQSKILLCINFHSKLFHYINQFSSEKVKRNKVIFMLNANFTGVVIHFIPEIDDIKQILKKSLKRWMKYIFSFGLYAEKQEFSKYIRSLTEFEEQFAATDLSVESIANLNQEIGDYEIALANCMDRYSEVINEFSKS